MSDKPLCRWCAKSIEDGQAQPDPLPPDHSGTVQSFVHAECARGIVHADAEKRSAARSRLESAAPALLAACKKARALLEGLEPPAGPWTAYLQSLKETLDVAIARAEQS